MKPSSVARRKRTTDRSFVAIDFETANQSRDSACSIGIAIAEGGRIVALEQRLIRPPTSEFFFTYIWAYVERGAKRAIICRSVEGSLSRCR